MLNKTIKWSMVGLLLSSHLVAIAWAGHHTVITVQILGDDASVFPVYPISTSHSNSQRSWLQAERGARYGIQIKNNRNKRIGLVIAVDGRNIISGKKSWLRNTERMYVLDPYDQATYDGWRTGSNHVNRFYFSSENNSYAGAFGDRTAMGVIAIAVFPEQEDHHHHPSFDYYSEEQKKATPVPRAPQAYRGRSSSKSTAGLEGSSGDNAGTGYGQKEYSASRKVEFTSKSYPLVKYFYKYEWKDVLCNKGIISCKEQKNRFWPEAYDYAPPPPGHQHYH